MELSLPFNLSLTPSMSRVEFAIKLAVDSLWITRLPFLLICGLLPVIVGSSTSLRALIYGRLSCFQLSLLGVKLHNLNDSLGVSD